MIDVRRAAERYRIDTTPGVSTQACFSSGPYYDPGNVRFGPLLACDEHVVAPGAGFAAHPHAGVELLTLVLDGTLTHEDEAGERTDVTAGMLAHQLAGSRIAHAERNASATEPLRFVQVWLEHDGDSASYEVGATLPGLCDGTVDVFRGCAASVVAAAGHAHVFVAEGTYTVAGHALAPGDSLRVREESITVDGDGVLLVVRVEV